MPDTTIIADTSCLIILKTIDEFDLLNKVFGEIIITQEIFNEFGNELPKWIKVLRAPKNISKALAETVDIGEASAIALALEMNSDCLLLLDDLRARKFARKIDLKVLGTLGVIAKAEKLGIIERGMILIEKIQLTNFRLSQKIVEEIKKELK